MNRRVSQVFDVMDLNSAKLCVKLCETLRDIFFHLLVNPVGGEAVNPLSDNLHGLKQSSMDLF